MKNVIDKKIVILSIAIGLLLSLFIREKTEFYIIIGLPFNWLRIYYNNFSFLEIYKYVALYPLSFVLNVAVLYVVIVKIKGITKSILKMS